MNFAIDTFSKERFGIVTGSRCTPLVPKRSAEAGQITLAKQLANEIHFQFYDEYSSWQTEHGKMAEHFAHEHFKTYVDPEIQHGGWYKHGEIGGNTDAEGKTYGVDYKCPTSLEGWLDYLYDGISDKEYNQCQLYLKLTDKDKWIIAAYLTETLFMSDNGLKYPVAEKDRMILIEVLPDLEWNKKFDANLPFVIEKRNEFLKVLRNRFK